MVQIVLISVWRTVIWSIIMTSFDLKLVRSTYMSLVMLDDTFIIDDGNKFDSLQIERMKFAESASGFVAVVYDITAYV